MNTLNKVLWTTAALAGLAFLLAPAPAVAAQCFVTDVIAQGSMCAGFDCSCSESFGFDTIRLKENNLRIHFDDTSSSASFPKNDYRIIINDSSNGGASYFGIEDSTAGRRMFTLEAGAPAHSLYVDDGGRIGNGTSTPVVDIHIKSGNTPTLRLEQDGTSGFTPQTWDVAGNETNFFIRDATNGSALPFRIRPSAPGNSIFVDTTGDVGFGTASPDAALDIVNDGATTIELENTSGETWRFNSAGNGNFRISDEEVTANTELELDVDGNLTITGTLTTAGTCSTGLCDGIFNPTYELEPIEDHAAYMWENSHLLGVGPTRAGMPMNLSLKTEGILSELEKAHIYIEQLHQRLERLEALIEDKE